MSEDAQEGARKSDRTRLTILGAARIAFARKGFSGVTIRDITDLACVTRASFYYYFRDKTELFIELGTATYREAMEVVETLGEDGTAPSRDSIAEWVSQYFKYLDRNGAFVIRSEEDMPQDATFRAAVARSHRRAATVLGQRITKIAATDPAVDAMPTGLAVMALLERSWLMAQHHTVSTMSRRAALVATSEVIWRMVDYAARD